jgi:peptidoglycan/LPS O-acetylase OafA/YrhL
MTTTYIQLTSIVLAGLALLLGAYLLIIGKRPWRGAEGGDVAPRVRLLGLSYILVFGAAMVQIIVAPTGVDAVALGALMVLGGMIVIIVVYLEARASRRASHEDRLDNRLRS